MNDLKELQTQLLNYFPGLTAVIDKPEDPEASWWLDVTSDGFEAVVEWRSHRGFGISAREREAFGEGPDEIHLTVGRAFERLTDLILGQRSTSPPTGIVFNERSSG